MTKAPKFMAVKEAKWDGIYHPYFYRLHHVRLYGGTTLYFALIPSNGDVPYDSYDITRHYDYLDMYLEYHGTKDEEDLSQ